MKTRYKAVSYYVSWNGGSKLVHGWKRSVALAVERSTQSGYAEIRQTILDGYLLLAEYRFGCVRLAGVHYALDESLRAILGEALREGAK